jgi:hypothetical protein
MQLQIKARLAVPYVLFVHDLLVPEVGDTGTTILLVGPHEQISLLGGLAERPPVDEALPTPFFRMRRDLILKKSPH